VNYVINKNEVAGLFAIAEYLERLAGEEATNEGRGHPGLAFESWRGP
jgi:hypothetical protein